jgi:hypothetical protein
MQFDEDHEHKKSLSTTDDEASTKLLRSAGMIAEREEPEEPTFLQELPSHLRGPGQNRYGGHQMCRMRGFKGADYKFYGPGRILEQEEKQRVIDELRARGEID